MNGGLDQRKDHDLAQIMSQAELSAYRAWERVEQQAEQKLHEARSEMRKLRARARRRKQPRMLPDYGSAV